MRGLINTHPTITNHPVVGARVPSKWVLLGVFVVLIGYCVPGKVIAQDVSGTLHNVHESDVDRHPAPASFVDATTQKCGTLLASPAMSQRPKARAMNAEPSTQNTPYQSHESPSGKFVLYYTLTGSDAVPSNDEDQNGIPDYVETAAAAADSSYKKMVLELGYTDPIPEGEMYRIDFENMGFYGYTYPSGDPSGTSISVHHDFVGFPQNDWPDGDVEGALLVTIAHEFKHAIQYADNRWSGGVGNQDWLEMDATMMEETVYDDVTITTLPCIQQYFFLPYPSYPSGIQSRDMDALLCRNVW